jgi:hypothetical protein
MIADFHRGTSFATRGRSCTTASTCNPGYVQALWRTDGKPMKAGSCPRHAAPGAVSCGAALSPPYLVCFVRVPQATPNGLELSGGSSCRSLLHPAATATARYFQLRWLTWRL